MGKVKDKSAHLMRAYAESRDENAFRQLVENHLAMVYATALRVGNGDHHFAEDIAQQVFSEVAQRAPELQQHPLLAGWLYRHTFFTASKSIRGARRRALREQAATEMNTTSRAEAERSQLEAELDPALNDLPQDERDLLVLRYFEKTDLRTIGGMIGTSEDAAQKRVSRALEKLRGVLEARGVTVAVGTLAAVLEASGAPAGLASKIAGTALSLTATTIAAKTAASLVTGVPGKFVLLAALAVAAGIPLLLQHSTLQQTREVNSLLRREVAALHNERDQSAENLRKKLAELERLRRDTADLHRLRAEVTRLKKLAPINPDPEAAGRDSTENNPGVASPPRQVLIEGKFLEVPLETVHEIKRLGIHYPLGEMAVEISPEQVGLLSNFLQERAGVQVVAAPKVQTLDGRQGTMSIGSAVEVNGESIQIGPTFSVIPTVSTTGGGINLAVEAVITEFLGLQQHEEQQIPRIRARAASAEKEVRAGGSLLLATTIQSGAGETDSSDSAKLLFVLISPMLITPEGTPVIATE